MKHVNRRKFLHMAGVALGTGVLAACATPTPQIVKETVVVEKPVKEPVKETVVVEKPVKETVVVEKPVAPTATPTPSPLKRLEGKKGRLWGLQYDPHVAAYDRLANLFNRRTGAFITVEPQGWPLETKLIAAMAAGTQPDIVCCVGKYLGPLHIQGGLMPLRDSVYNSMKVKPEETFFEDAVTAFSWKGEIYGVPVDAGGLGNVVNVPVDEVKRLGLDSKYPPTDGRIWWKDYPEMFELAKALQIEKDGKVVRWGLSSKGWESSSIIGMMRSLLAERGTDWWDLGKAKFNVDSDEGVQALKWYVEDPVKLGIETELDQNHVDAALAGKVALARGNGTPSNTITDALGYNFALAGVPMCVPNKPPLSCSEAGWGFIIPKTTKNPDISVEFVKMMTTREAQIEFDKAYGGIPNVAYKGLVGVYDHWSNPDPNGKAVKQAKMYQEKLLPLARYYGEQLGYLSEVDRIFGEVSQMVRQKKMTAKEACQDMQKQLEAQYKQWLEDVKKAA